MRYDKANGSNYLHYYVSLLFSNALMLSFYTVQAFSSSPPCLVDSGDKSGETNMTIWFDIAFNGGFSIHCVNFLFYAFADPYTRQIRQKKSSRARRQLGKTEHAIFLVAYMFEMLLRCFLYSGSVLQLVLLMTSESRYCTSQSRILKLEGHWLLALAFSQVILTTVFAVWKAVI